MIIAEFGYISGPFKGERYTGACGSGGDVRDLVCFAERAGFREAVHMLAEGYSEPLHHLTIGLAGRGIVCIKFAYMRALSHRTFFRRRRAREITSSAGTQT